MVLVGQLVRWQLIHGRGLAETADKERMRYEELEPRRGTIYSRDGRPLAIDAYAYALSAEPRYVRTPMELADRLFPLVGLSREETARRLRSAAAWQPLGSDLPLRVADEIAAWEEPGLYLEPELARHYPDGRIIEPLLGFVSSQSREGYQGVEGYYNSVLQGEPGARLGDIDGFGLDVPFGRSLVELPENGADIHLTVDSRVQYVLWRELKEGLEKYRAESGTIIAMDPRTGAILGCVSLPSYDPNVYEKAESGYEDPAVSYEYEPGSVFKVITMAAALDSGLFRPDSTYEDTGELEVAGAVIRNWDRSAHGLVTMTEVLALSLNTGAAFVSTSLGPERFYEYVTSFGFGQVTGVDLDAEASGHVKKPGDGRWYEADLATNAFGQGIAVTPLQMISAISAIANDGLLMKPFVAQYLSREGQTREHEPVPVRQVVSPEVASILKIMLVEAVEKETVAARVPGYIVGGKTGTAEIPIPGGYHPSDTIASFVGFLPAGDPQLCILVKIDKPQASRWGSTVAAPIFARVASELVVLLGIPPQVVTSAPET